MDENLVWKELKPTKEVEPGWWKLKWRPVKNGTYNIYLSKFTPLFGIRFWKNMPGFGYGRSYKGYNLEIGFYWTLTMWINYKFIKLKGT